MLSQRVTFGLIIVIAVLAICLAGCGGGNELPNQTIVQFRYMSDGLLLIPDATGMVGVAKSTPIMIRPMIDVMPQGGDGHMWKVEIRNPRGEVEEPWGKETWMLYLEGVYTAQVMDNGQPLPGKQRFVVVNPFSPFGDPYLSISQFGDEVTAGHYSGFWLILPAQRMELAVLHRPTTQMTTQGGPLPATFKIFDLDGRLVASGDEWVPTLGFYHIIATLEDGKTLSRWIYVLEGKG